MIKIKRLSDNAKLPTRGSETSAGLDLYATKDVFIPRGATASIPLDISIEIPSNCVAKIEDRSSLAMKGLRTGAGVVDSDYRGALAVVLHNLSNEDSREPVLHYAGYKVKKGDKIAQLLVYEVDLSKPVEVEDLTDTKRGSGGFGSTGR